MCFALEMSPRSRVTLSPSPVFENPASPAPLHAKCQGTDAPDIYFLHVFLSFIMKRASTDSDISARSGPPMSSLFGQSAQTPSLFGSNPTSNSTSQPAQTSTLFGNLNTSKPDEKSSTLGGSTLFSGLGGQSKPEPAPSLFGGLASTSQPQTTSSGGGGGLFGTAQPAGTQTPGSSLLGNPTTTSAPSLFGNVANSTTAAPSIFGNPATTSAPLGSSLFVSQPPQQQAQATQPQQQNGQPGGGSSQISQPAYFNSLLEKGKKRARFEGSGSGDMPSLQLGLGDIGRRARELGASPQQSQVDGGRDGRA